MATQVRLTRNGTNALNIQKAINADYVALVKDYKKLFIELSRNSYARFIFGGIALAVAAPIAYKLFNENSDTLTVEWEKLKDKFANFSQDAGDTINDVSGNL